MPAIFGLFDILALLYIFRSIQLGLVIWRERATIRQEPLNRRKKHLAEQAAFFIAVPLSVFAHEFSHALAVWLFGGEVVEFGYRGFWGYVIPAGSFTPAQNWFIALAGTLGSLAFGLAVWLLLRRSSVSSLRYFGLRTLRFQVYFSLFYYPLLTLLGFDGDWRTIYDFSATPILSAVTAVTHAGFLVLFFYGDRQGWFEAVAHETIADQTRFIALETAVYEHPDDPARQLAYMDALRRGGANRRAQHQLKQFLQRRPDSAAGHLQMAALLTDGKRSVSKKAQAEAQQALSLGLSDSRQRAFAFQLIARYEIDMGNGKQAVDYLTQAITAVAPTASADALPLPQAAQLAQYYYLRSQSYRRLQKYFEAYNDLQLAIQIAQRYGDETAVVQYRSELDVLQKHAGKRFEQTPL